jgi:hypothetical protein
MVIAQVCGILGHMSSDDKAFRNTMDELNVMMQDRQLPHDMRKRLRSFFLSNKEAQRHERQAAILQAMSPGLQGELSVQMNRMWLAKVSFLREFLSKAERGQDRHVSGFIADVSRSLHKEVHAQSDVFGQMQMLYILNRGLCTTSKNGGRVNRAGDVWGMDFVLCDVTLMDPCDCFALTYCEMMMLKRDAFMAIVEERTLYCAEIKVKVRQYTVRLAAQRGILIEARRRIAEHRKTQPLGTPERRSEADSSESVAGFAIRPKSSGLSSTSDSNKEVFAPR